MSQQEWYVDVQGTARGPYGASQLREFATNGQIQPTTNVMLGAQGKWMPAGRIPGLFPAAAAAQSAPPQAANYPTAATVVHAAPAMAYSAQGNATTKPATGDVIGTPVMACGLVGAAMLIAGVFMPFVQAPFVGSINYFTITKLDTSIIIGVGVIAAVAVLLKVTWPLVVGGLVSLGFLTYRFTNFNVGMSRAKESFKDEMSDNMFAGLADAFTEGVGIQWGFAVLLLGSLAIIIAPMLREFRKQSDRTNTIVSGLVTALVVVLGVGGITYLTFGKEQSQVAMGESTESNSSIVSSFGPSKPRKPKEEVIPNPVKLGQTIQLGNLKITPKTAVKRPISVSRSISRDDAKQLDGPFLVITAEVENTSEGQVFSPYSNPEGIDNYGNKFEAYDSTFSQVVDPEKWRGDLKPGERATITLILEPKNLSAKWFRIVVTQTVDNQEGRFEEWSIQLSNQ